MITCHLVEEVEGGEILKKFSVTGKVSLDVRQPPDVLIVHGNTTSEVYLYDSTDDEGCHAYVKATCACVPQTSVR